MGTDDYCSASHMAALRSDMFSQRLVVYKLVNAPKETRRSQ